MPEELQVVLVHGEHENEYFNGFGVTWLSYGKWVGSVHPVTHWMELPQPPNVMILFYVEFDNGDSNCYQGVRVPTLDEARKFCEHHIQSSSDWEDVAHVAEINREQAEGLWDLQSLEDTDWPIFRG